MASAENDGPLKILGRSWELSKGNWWRLFGFLLLFGVGALCLIYAVDSVVGLLVRMTLEDTGPRAIGGLIISIVSQLVSALLSVILFVMLARIYEQRNAGGRGFNARHDPRQLLHRGLAKRRRAGCCQQDELRAAIAPEVVDDRAREERRRAGKRFRIAGAVPVPHRSRFAVIVHQHAADRLRRAELRGAIERERQPIGIGGHRLHHQDHLGVAGWMRHRRGDRQSSGQRHARRCRLRLR